MSREKDNAIANNKKASHLYFIEDTYETGIELFGTEVKSIRAGQVNIKDSYCDINYECQKQKNFKICIYFCHTLYTFSSISFK